MARSFVWGNKLHNVAWKQVTAPKSAGGLGIRQVQATNKALIAKLGWSLIHDQDSLWARLLRKKYKVGDIHDASWLVAKSNSSSTWRSIITGIRELVKPGSSWVIGDGRKIRFRSDRWLFNSRFIEDVVGDLPIGSETVVARDLWQDGRGWDMDRIAPFVSENQRLELLSVVIDNFTGARDQLSWSESADGEFSVKTAYNLLTKDTNPGAHMGRFYGRVWKVVAPERVKFFLWQVGNQSILTNAERHRRHLCASDLCQVCKSGSETILHILRDCPAMAGIWNRMVPQQRRSAFFSQSLLEWMFSNLGDDGELFGSCWSTIFAMAIWWAWKWRCDNVFGNNGKCRDRIRFIKELAKEVTTSFLAQNENLSGRARVQRMIGWATTTPGWLKLNTDGASHGNPGPATAGGVIRDEYEGWRGGFALNIGRCTTPLAELWGVYYGLYMAWEQRVTRLEVEVDSAVVVEFLKTGISDMHHLSFLVRLCHDFLSRHWIVRISHVYREANRLVDGLANYAFSLPLGFHPFLNIPDVVESLHSDDVIGSARPRLIRL